MNNKEIISLIKKKLKNIFFVTALQREPYIHIKTTNGIKLEKSAGGVHVLIDAILKKSGGLMVAYGGGSGDKLVVDKDNKIKVPPREKFYELKRIFLKKKEIEGWYYGFANQTLWPLCHAVFIKPNFNYSWWDSYLTVNKKFAEAIIEEIKNKNAFVWINDYHLALVPAFLREKINNIKIGFFWHIPWPTYEIMRINPWRKEIIKSLLKSNFVGFHRGYHVENFIECARRELGILLESEPKAIEYENHITKLDNIPAGIDYFEIKNEIEKNKKISPDLIQKDFGFDYQYLIIGVDRIDYTKGLVERLHIIDRFFEKYPQFQGKAVYLSIGAPSRLHIPAYKNLNKEIMDLVEKINWKYFHNNWQPIHFVNKIISREKILKYYQLADLCLVTSLDDGMNLVAKEFVVACQPEKGFLILSKFTGAAKDLKDAILINPYDTEGSADALYLGLNMKKEEKIRKNIKMKSILKQNNIYQWAYNFITQSLD